MFSRVNLFASPEKIGLTCVFMRTPKKGVVVRRHPLRFFGVDRKRVCVAVHTLEWNTY
ncbi:Uncharacterised protein [Mycobacteroides abscessus subsp. abscessus]|nr:Uncharacterised protein [Mycobacteroides abscessus subsp. abscessus]